MRKRKTPGRQRNHAGGKEDGNRCDSDDFSLPTYCSVGYAAYFRKSPAAVAQSSTGRRLSHADVSEVRPARQKRRVDRPETVNGHSGLCGGKCADARCILSVESKNTLL